MRMDFIVSEGAMGHKMKKPPRGLRLSDELHAYFEMCPGWPSFLEALDPYDDYRLDEADLAAMRGFLQGRLDALTFTDDYQVFEDIKELKTKGYKISDITQWCMSFFDLIQYARDIDGLVWFIGD
ncbi:MAG: hypothetical protein FWF59_07690 [Turicibacter sp.]|nr:hypothetical protein [Turicibacter sp.]